METRPELTTSRTGGRGARLIALAIVVALGSVIYVGVTGRSPSASPAPSPDMLAQASVAVATDATAERAGVATARPRVLPGPEGVPHGRLAAAMTLGDDSLFAPMDEIGRDRLRASYLVPLPASASLATIEVLQVDNLATRTTAYGTWSVAIGVFHGGVDEESIIGSFAPTVLVDTRRRPDPYPAADAPDIARNGYSIRVTGQRAGSGEIVAVELEVAAPKPGPDEDYRVSARADTHLYRGEAERPSPGRAGGVIAFPRSLRSKAVSLELSARPQGDPLLGRSVVASFDVALPPADGYPVGSTALDVAVAASADGSNIFGILRNGYRLTARYALVGGARAIDYVVTVNPDTGPGG